MIWEVYFKIDIFYTEEQNPHNFNLIRAVRNYKRMCVFPIFWGTYQEIYLKFPLEVFVFIVVQYSESCVKF